MKLIILFPLFLLISNNNNGINGTWEVYNIDYTSEDKSIEGMAKETLIVQRLMAANYVFKIQNDSLSVITNNTLLDKTKLINIKENELHIANKVIKYELDEDKTTCKFIFSEKNAIFYARKKE